MSRETTSKLLKKRAMDALLETMGETYKHDSDPHYAPLAQKGTEMESNHTDLVIIPTVDLHVAGAGDDDKGVRWWPTNTGQARWNEYLRLKNQAELSGKYESIYYYVQMDEVKRDFDEYMKTHPDEVVDTTEPKGHHCCGSKHKKAAGDTLYHVTYTKNIAKIKKKGILPLQTTNWVQGPKGERYGGGEIYAFDNPNDAVRWAGKMDWEFNKSTGSGKISIVIFSKGDTKWEVDTNDQLSQSSRKGNWLKSNFYVPAENIIKIVPLTVDMVRAIISNEDEDVKLASDELSHKKQFERLYKQWKAFREKIHEKTPESVKKYMPIALKFIERLQSLESIQDTELFEGTNVSFKNTTNNLNRAVRQFKELELMVQVIGSEWENRYPNYNEGTLRDKFNNAMDDVNVGFHNLGVEYYYLTAPRDEQGKVKWSATTPITASFNLIAYDYKKMFQQLLAAIPSLEAGIDGEIAWAKATLKKQDRITWYLRWVRLYLENINTSSKNPKIQQLLTQDIAVYSKKNPITKDMIPSSLRDIKSKLEHWMGLPDKAVQDKVFVYETYQQLSEAMDKIEEEIKERQESERRVITQRPLREDDENEDEDSRQDNGESIFMQFPDGWVWLWLHRAYCSEESRAMGHCGNSPRSDSDDTILSLRQPVQKGGITYWSPHLTFIFDADNVIGEMKGRNNAKPIRRYHPYIIALLKDQRIKGIKGGGYLPSHNFRLGDLTRAEIAEVKKANPNLTLDDSHTPANIIRVAEAMGLEEDSYNAEHDLFVVNEWRDVERMVRDKGNGEADTAMDYALQYESRGDFNIKDSELPDVDDIAEELATNLSVAAMRNMVNQLKEEESWVIDDYEHSKAENEIDYTIVDNFYGLMVYTGQQAYTSRLWETIKDAYRQGKEIRMHSRRISDLEYLIDQDVYEQGEGHIYTEFRFGPDMIRGPWEWTTAPAWEVITWKNAMELMEDDDADHDIHDGQLDLYLSEYYNGDDDDNDDGNEESYDKVDEWYTNGIPKEKNEDQMEFQFESSLLKKAAQKDTYTSSLIKKTKDLQNIAQEILDAKLHGGRNYLAKDVLKDTVNDYAGYSHIAIVRYQGNLVAWGGVNADKTIDRFVHPDHRNRGIGDALVNTLNPYAKGYYSTPSRGSSVLKQATSLPKFDEIHYIYYPDSDVYNIVGFLNDEGLFSKMLPSQHLRGALGEHLAEQIRNHEGQVINPSNVTGDGNKFKSLTVHSDKFNNEDNLMMKSFGIRGFVEIKETPRVLPQRDDLRGHLDETTKIELMDGVIDGAPEVKKPVRLQQIDPNIMINAADEGVIMSPKFKNKLLQSPSSEGKVMPRGGNWKLYAFKASELQINEFGAIVRPIPKAQIWYVGDKIKALPIIDYNWGPLTHEQENQLLSVGRLEIEGMDLRLTCYSYSQPDDPNSYKIGKTAFVVDTAPGQDPDYVKAILTKLHQRFNDLKEQQPKGYQETFQRLMPQQMREISKELGLSIACNPQTGVYTVLNKQRQG